MINKRNFDKLYKITFSSLVLIIILTGNTLTYSELIEYQIDVYNGYGLYTIVFIFIYIFIFYINKNSTSLSIFLSLRMDSTSRIRYKIQVVNNLIFVTKTLNFWIHINWNKFIKIIIIGKIY